MKEKTIGVLKMPYPVDICHETILRTRKKTLAYDETRDYAT